MTQNSSSVVLTMLVHLEEMGERGGTIQQIKQQAVADMGKDTPDAFLSRQGIRSILDPLIQARYVSRLFRNDAYHYALTSEGKRELDRML